MIAGWKIKSLAMVTLAVCVGCGSPKADRTVSSTENSSLGAPLELPVDLGELRQKVDDLKSSIEEILANFDFTNLVGSLTSLTPEKIQQILDDLKTAGVDLDDLIAEIQNQISSTTGTDLQSLTDQAELEQLLTDLQNSQGTVDDLIKTITDFLGL
jgi:hypothetical protein